MPEHGRAHNVGTARTRGKRIRRLLVTGGRLQVTTTGIIQAAHLRQKYACERLTAPDVLETAGERGIGTGCPQRELGELPVLNKTDDFWIAAILPS